MDEACIRRRGWSGLRAPRRDEICPRQPQHARANPGQAKLFTAHWGKEPVAAILILRHGAAATYHIGHIRSSGRLMSAHNLLMWSVMLWAKAKGAASLAVSGLIMVVRPPSLLLYPKMALLHSLSARLISAAAVHPCVRWWRKS